MNVLFEYLYRDSGNNKKWGEVVFANRRGLPLPDLEAKVRASLIDGEFFVPHDTHLPKLAFDRVCDMDHGWYEFAGVSETSREVDDVLSRDILRLISVLKGTNSSAIE